MLKNALSLSLPVILASTAVAVLTQGTSSAAPLCLPDACATSRETIPGSGGTTGGDEGGGGGSTGPGLGCPTIGGRITCTDGPAPAAVDTTPTIDVVYEARDRLLLPKPTIHTAPSPRTYVQLRTELSVDPDDVADVTAHAQVPEGAAVPDQAVTVQATDATVTWDMGEGRTVTCKGTAACDYTYQRSSARMATHKYTITVTVSWRVSWTCVGDACDGDGDGGTMDDPISMQNTATLAVGEIQTESKPG
jgi:hypothetical protein